MYLLYTFVFPETSLKTSTSGSFILENRLCGAVNHTVFKFSVSENSFIFVNSQC
jgi:hypothetical protein